MFFMHNKDTNHLKDSKGFRASVPVTEDKTNFFFIMLPFDFWGQWSIITLFFPPRLSVSFYSVQQTKAINETELVPHHLLIF